jgi:hypothetical protein
VANAHGGDVHVRSAPGEGSEFEVVLPAVADGVPDKPSSAARRDWRGVLERRPQNPDAGEQDVGQRW